MAETVFTFSSSADLNQTKDGITLVIAKGNGQTEPVYKESWNIEYQPNEMRLYLGNTITVSGEGLSSIQLVCAKSGASNKEYAGLSASTGSLVTGGVAENATDWKVDSWTGNASSVVFTLTGKGQRQIQQIVVNGEPVELKPEEEEQLPTAEDLDPAYEYAEPTNVSPKDTTIIKKEYAFIDNNILVHCSLGSILKAEEDTDAREDVDNSHPAYFNCNADYQLTFSATQPIKGIAIDGFVRKAFDATCDHGTIQFLTDPDMDMEGWPALVIMDINATSVTLDCPKQLRCYGVHVYFQDNPDPLYEQEGLETIHSHSTVTKMLRDGQLVIIKDKKQFTVNGTEVQ